MDIFLTKNASIRYRRPLFTPRCRVRHVLIMDAHTLFDYFWTVEKKKTPFKCLEEQGIFFNITPIGLI